MLLSLASLVISMSIINQNYPSSDPNYFAVQPHEINMVLDNSTGLYIVEDNDYGVSSEGFTTYTLGSFDVDEDDWLNFKISYYFTATLSNGLTYSGEFGHTIFKLEYDSTTQHYMWDYVLDVENSYIEGSTTGFNYIPHYSYQLKSGVVGFSLNCNYTDYAYLTQLVYDHSMNNGELSSNVILNDRTLYLNSGFSFQYLPEDVYELISSSNQSSYQDGYNNGFNNGFAGGYAEGNRDGYNSGYTDGYDDGISYNDGTITEIFANIIQVGMLPVNLFLNIFNFEVFGINIGAIVSGLMTLCLTIIIIRMIKGSSSGGDS